MLSKLQLYLNLVPDTLPDANHDMHEFFVFCACFHSNIHKRQSDKCTLNADETCVFSMGSNYCVSRVVES